MTEANPDTDRLILITVDIVSAYVSNNHVQGADLPKLLGDVHGAVRLLSGSSATAEDPGLPKATAQEIKRSVAIDYLISFEDGKPYKTLRRHLTLRGLSPEQYRAKWGLPPDYPMTSQAYSEQRSELARALGLGQQRRRPDPEPEAASVSEAPPEKKARAPRKKSEV